MSLQQYQLLLSKYEQLFKEQQAAIDMLINLSKDTLDELDGLCNFFKNLKEIIENDLDDGLLERFK